MSSSKDINTNNRACPISETESLLEINEISQLMDIERKDWANGISAIDAREEANIVNRDFGFNNLFDEDIEEENDW